MASFIVSFNFPVDIQNLVTIFYHPLNKNGKTFYFCLSYLKLFCVLPSFAYLFYSHVEEELLLLDRASLECSCTLHNHSTVMADDSSNDRHLSPKLVETVFLNPFEIAQHINFKQIVLKAFKTARKIWRHRYVYKAQGWNAVWIFFLFSKVATPLIFISLSHTICALVYPISLDVSIVKPARLDIRNAVHQQL